MPWVGKDLENWGKTAYAILLLPRYDNHPRRDTEGVGLMDYKTFECSDCGARVRLLTESSDEAIRSCGFRGLLGPGHSWRLQYTNTVQRSIPEAETGGGGEYYTGP